MKNSYSGNYNWCLSWFDPETEELVSNKEVSTISDQDIRSAFGFSGTESLIGEIPVTPEFSKSVSEIFGEEINLNEFDYFVGATSNSEK